jgi:ABC-type phosphate transport system substrate-binding protein
VKRFGLLLAAVALTLGALAAATPAGASPPSGYGFDNSAHIIIGGGSDTTYKAMVGITDLYDGSKGCEVSTSGTTINQCVVPSPNNPETNTLGNYQRDTVAQANPAGSGAGINALNGVASTSYAGTTGGKPDFARSSREPKKSTGAAPCINEVGPTCDTFWGFAQDGVEVMAFNARATQLQGLASPALTKQTLIDIYTCVKTNWGQVTGDVNDNTRPIVPWRMNTASGTYGTFQTYLGLSNLDSSLAGCANSKQLSNLTNPLENNVAPLIANQPTNNTLTSVDNPENWIWWGSFGEMSTFPFKAKATGTGSVVYTSADVPVEGIRPNGGTILDQSYPIGRTLYHVTLKADADCVNTDGGSPGTTDCDFAFTDGSGAHGQPGPVISGSNTDLNVIGGTTGTSGAVREFTRFLCRPSAAQHTADPYTGINNFTGITSAVSKAGYQVVPTSLRTPGSRCHVVRH